MIRYETLILAVPEITANETAALEESINKLIKKFSGISQLFERWGKYRLMYPVRTNEYGVYFLSRFDVDEQGVHSLIKELHTLLAVKQEQLVMRYMTTRLDKKQPLTYQKPESLEDIPSQDVPTFLRENNMEGLLKKTPGMRGKENEYDHNGSGESFLSEEQE